jgi:hypothetical protein
MPDAPAKSFGATIADRVDNLIVCHGLLVMAIDKFGLATPVAINAERHLEAARAELAAAIDAKFPADAEGIK